MQKVLVANTREPKKHPIFFVHRAGARMRFIPDSAENISGRSVEAGKTRATSLFPR